MGFVAQNIDLRDINYIKYYDAFYMRDKVMQNKKNSLHSLNLNFPPLFPLTPYIYLTPSHFSFLIFSLLPPHFPFSSI